MNPYQKLMSRKRTWTPVAPQAGAVKDGAEETLKRVIALRHMELPVGDFITDALSKDIPDAARELLLSNVRDEEKHDLALNLIASAHGLDEEAEKEAIKLQQAWIAHPDPRYSKPWLLNVQFSSYFYPSCALTVTQLCVQPQT